MPPTPPPLAAEAPAWSAYGPVGPLPPPLIRDPGLPLVSVVTPSFNQGAYIAETVASVLGQGYLNLEHWVVDGGSTDGTLEALAPFRGDPRLHVIVGPDRGQADAINKGWARCRGQVLAWLNSDDTYLPGAIASQLRELTADPAAGGVYADALYTDAAGRPLQRLHARPYHPLAILRLEIPAQPTVFLRRGLVAALGPLDVGRRYSMDSDYWARAAALAPLRQAQALVATYRLHPQSKTVGQPAGFYAEWLDIARRFFARPGLPAELRAGRGAALADIYAAMANLEAGAGRPREAARYLGYALTLAGPRPRILKLPLALLDRALPLGLSARATALWGRLRRGW